MLSKFDDFPIHQTTRPLAVPATTDRHHYDRYWFNGYAGDGEFYFGIGAALYPNLGIMDCGFSIIRDGVQHAFHGSCRAPAPPGEIEVGPFRIEILEPMKSLRVVLDRNETGIACDLEWIPRTANFVEGHQELHRNPMHMVATRFNQFGHWKGEIRYAGQSLQVDPKRVYGTKDRSWGIRPVGDPAPPGAPPLRPAGIFFLWAPLHWEDHCTHAIQFENEYGEPWHREAMIVPAYASPDELPGIEDPGLAVVPGLERHIEYYPGTRRMCRAEITLTERSGKVREIELEPILCFRMKGIGYTHLEWGHGRWKGELAIGGESWAADELDEMAIDNIHVQQVVRARCDGREGVGVMEQLALGPHAPSGFKEFLDPAR